MNWKRILTKLDQPSFADRGIKLPLWKSVVYDFMFIITFGFLGHIHLLRDIRRRKKWEK
jgi:hypothetical protein